MEYIENDLVEIKKPTQNKDASRRKKMASQNSQSTTTIRITRSTERSLRTIIRQLNKKKIGRKVVIDDVISKALTLIQKEHLEEIKRSTHSAEDLLNLKHQQHCEQHGYISKKRFLEILFEAELPSSEAVSKSDLNEVPVNSNFE